MIPDRYCTIRSTGSECIVNRMKSEGVHGPDVIDLIDRLAVGFESVFLGLGGRGRVKVFDCYATFCRCCCIAYRKEVLVDDDDKGKRRRANEKGWERGALAPPGGISSLTLAIHHTRQTSRHKLQTTFSLLSWRVHLPDVVYVKQPRSHRYDKSIACEVCLVYSFRKVV